MLLNYQQKQSSLNEADQKSDIIFVLHGLFGSLSNLAGLTASLESHYQVISVDLRNHGNSLHCPTMSYPEMASDIFELADHLNIEKFSIVGHSMGGKIGMTCALLQPERINKLVVADIAPSNYQPRHLKVFEALQSLMNHPIENRKSADQTLSKSIRTADTRQFLLKSLRKVDNRFQLQFNLEAISKNYDLIRGWPKFDQIFNKKTLFIKGADSDYITQAHQADILHLFPQASVKIISNTGHWLHAEKPKTFNRLVNQFLG